MKVVIAVVAILLLGYLLLRRTSDISGADARRLVGEGAKLVDVRSPEEFAGGHLPGAINVPVQQLDGRMGEIGPHDQPVVVYCQSGMRSARAASTLRQAGFASVHNLGPMSAW